MRSIGVAAPVSRGVAVAVVAVAVVAAIRAALTPVLHAEAPLVLFIVPVALAGHIGGLWAGLLATGLGLATGVVLFIQPYGGLESAADLVRLVLFAVAGALLSALNEALHRSRTATRQEAEHARAAEASLRAGEDRLRGVIESAMDAIISTDASQRIVIFNPAAERMFRCAAADAIGTPLDRFIPSRYRAAHAHHVRDFGETQQTTRAMGHLGTVHGLRATGEEFPIEASISQTRTGTQQIYTVILRDITGRQSAEAERERFYHAIADANRTKDEFLATLSHELRTPLNVMLGWIRRLRHARTDADMVQRGLEVIERNTRAQQRLIDDLLDLSRVSRGQMHIELHPIDLLGVVTQVVESSRPAAEAKSLNLAAVLPEPGTCVVSGDASRLQQVVANLLSNAIKFTPPAGHVTVSLAVDGNGAVLEVRDTGAGIPAEFLPHVFEQFRQQDSAPSRNFGGLGLGLAIVRHIVHLHGGRADAHSDGVGKGATLRVVLPLLAVSPDEPPSFRGRRAEDVSLDGIRVIAVENEPDTRNLLGQLLRQWGADVRTAGSAREAMEQLIENPPDVLVSDIGLPDQDGYTLIRQLRALAPEAGGGIPAVALTAYATADDRARALAAGFQLYLAKPIDPDALRVSVSRLVRPS